MPDDEYAYELVRGELLVMSKPGFRHGRIAANIGGLLWEHVRKARCGVAFAADSGFLLGSDPDTVRAPDAAFISNERMEQVAEMSKFCKGAPDLAVEVVSPNDPPRAVREKALMWLTAGTIAVLVLDPAERTAMVYRPEDDTQVHHGGDTVDLGDAVPGFSAGVDELFA